MVEQDKQQFAEMIIATMELYNKHPSKMAIKMYWNVLERFSIEQVEHGLKAHLNDTEQGKFQPKPADIIRHIEGTKADRKTAAEAAWHTVLSNVNRYDSTVFDDPAIHYAIMIGFGSWLNVCDFDKDDFSMQQMYRSFINAYSSYNGQPYIPRMVGIYEQESAQGPTQYVIRYHGDEDKALAVESGGRTGSIGMISAVKVEAIEHDVVQIGDGA